MCVGPAERHRPVRSWPAPRNGGSRSVESCKDRAEPWPASPPNMPRKIVKPAPQQVTTAPGVGETGPSQPASLEADAAGEVGTRSFWTETGSPGVAGSRSRQKHQRVLALDAADAATAKNLRVRIVSDPKHRLNRP